jgi:hypothetical protein
MAMRWLSLDRVATDEQLIGDVLHGEMGREEGEDAELGGVKDSSRAA